MKKLFSLSLILLFSISIGFAISDNVPDTHKENIEVVSFDQMESNIVADHSILIADANTTFTCFASYLYNPTTYVRLSEVETSSIDYDRLGESFEPITLVRLSEVETLLNWPRYWHSIHSTNTQLVISSGDEILHFYNSASILSKLSTHLGNGLVEEKANAPNGAPPSFFNPNYFRHFSLC